MNGASDDDATPKRWHCSGFVHPVSMNEFLDPLGFGLQVNFGRPAAAEHGCADRAAGDTPLLDDSSHPHLSQGVMGRWSAAGAAEPVMLETNGCYLNVYTVSNVEHGGNPFLVASVNVNDCGSIALLEPRLFDLPAHLAASHEFQQLSRCCFAVEALQGHRELLVFKAPRPEDADEWVSVLQGLRGTSFLEAKDRQRDIGLFPQQQQQQHDPEGGQTENARRTRATDAASEMLGAPLDVSSHSHTHLHTAPSTEAVHSHLASILVASPSRTVPSVPAHLAEVEQMPGDPVVIAEVAGAAKAKMFGNDAQIGIVNEAEGWNLDENIGRKASDSVYSVESIDDSDIPKCSFMKDPAHDADGEEHQESGPSEDSEYSDEGEGWEKVQRCEAKPQGNGCDVLERGAPLAEGAPNSCIPETWARLTPGLGPAPSGWRRQWRTLFMP